MAVLKAFFPSQVFHTLTQCRLCRHVTAAVFVAILLVEGAILIFSVNNFERDRLLEVEREGLSVVRAWLQISGDNPATLNKMAPMIGGGSILVSAVVRDAAGNKVANLMQSSVSAQAQETFQAHWTAQDLGAPYSVRAILDKTEIPIQIKAFIWRIVGLVLLISVFVTLATMLILEYLMLRPIRALRARMRDACSDLSHPERHLIEERRNDELGDVGFAFNDLLSRLGLAFTEIRTQQDTLLNSNEKLEQLVSDRTTELKHVVRDLRREAVERERVEQALNASQGGGSAEHLKRLAYTDTLTGLANRDLFLDRSEQVITRLKSNDIQAAVHLIDLDGFNTINENYGQATGDLVLQTVAERLGELVGESDTLARLSADEFALIQLDVSDGDMASVLAQRITERLHDPIELGEDTLELACSIGITMLPLDEAKSEDILHHAALAQKRAKADQGSSYHFYAEQMNEQAKERQVIERDLKRALAHEEFELFYQPKLNVKSGQVLGMEALIRWNHPERGFLPPGLFIPVAERSPLIVPIGEWVLRDACRQARRWQVEGLGDLKVAVNVSAVQLQETCIVTTVRQILLESGLPAHLLELEITESAVMENVEHTISVLENLRDLGVSLSIDDFGTGYSSLNYLNRFPVKRIKIDKAFVDEIIDENSDGVIARAVITMGHSLGMEITGEGVEEEGQLAFLRDQGCDEIQGYLFAKPMNAQNFEAFVSDQKQATLAAQ